MTNGTWLYVDSVLQFITMENVVKLVCCRYDNQHW